MRVVFALTVLTCLAGCSGDPRSLGITGPGAPVAAAATPTDPLDTSVGPGVSTTGTPYGPTNGPSTGNSGFWGYNN